MKFLSTEQFYMLFIWENSHAKTNGSYYLNLSEFQQDDSYTYVIRKLVITNTILKICDKGMI